MQACELARERTEDDRKGEATTMLDWGPRGQLAQVENDSPEPGAVRSGKPELDLRALGLAAVCHLDAIQRSSLPPRVQSVGKGVQQWHPVEWAHVCCRTCNCHCDKCHCLVC